jgi:hypothetical protein
MCDTLDRYIENVGHEPPLDESDSAWQWDYRGTKAERELLLDLIQTEAEEAAAEQMSLC